MLTKQLDTIDITQDQQYLENRLWFFFNFTVPSVKAQTSKNFEWLILFSANTPQSIRAKIEGLEAECPHFHILYVDDSENIQDILYDYIYRQDASLYITSRLDNDDAIATNFIECIQNYVQNHQIGRYILLFNNGCQYDLKSHVFSHYSFTKNHFSSLVSDKSVQRETIIDYNHMLIHKYIHTINLNNDQPMWLEIIHGMNVSNRMHYKFKDIINNNAVFELFGIKKQKLCSPLSAKINAYTLTPQNLIRLFRQYGIAKIVQKIKEKISNI